MTSQVHHWTSRGCSQDTFVEIEVRLKKNPVVQSLEALVETIGGIRILTSFNQGEKKSQEQRNQETNLSRIAEQSKNLLGGLTGRGASDLVGEVVPGPGHAVVSVEDRYFSEHSSDEIADGQFRVFGKVARVVNDDDGISLLRNTKFASMPTALEPLRVGFAQMRGSGPKIPEFETEIKPPALQIRAIAIYL
jgi:hypothetical protein